MILSQWFLPLNSSVKLKDEDTDFEVLKSILKVVVWVIDDGSPTQSLQTDSALQDNHAAFLSVAKQKAHRFPPEIQTLHTNIRNCRWCRRMNYGVKQIGFERYTAAFSYAVHEWSKREIKCSASWFPKVLDITYGCSYLPSNHIPNWRFVKLINGSRHVEDLQPKD